MFKVPFKKLNTVRQIEAISEVLELILAKPEMKILTTNEREEILNTQDFSSLSMMILIDESDDIFSQNSLKKIWDAIRKVEEKFGFDEKGHILNWRS